MTGRSPFEIFHPDYHAKVRERIGVLQAGTAVSRTDEQVVRLDGTIRDVEVAAFPFEDAGGPAIEVILHDITDRKAAQRELVSKNEELSQLNEELQASQEELYQTEEELYQTEEDLRKKVGELNEMLAEKEILLSEIHHRVKNNLTAFISLLSLDGGYEDTDTGRALKKDLQSRARSMALIHETLYQTGKFSHVDMNVYLTNLITQIAHSYAGKTAVETVVGTGG